VPCSSEIVLNSFGEQINCKRLSAPIVNFVDGCREIGQDRTRRDTG
jgi:hypothetical protein